MYCMHVLERLLSEENYSNRIALVREFVSCIDNTYFLDKTFHNTIVRMLINALSRKYEIDLALVLSRYIDSQYRIVTRDIMINEIVNCLKRYIEENRDTEFAKAVLEGKIVEGEYEDDIYILIGNVLVEVYLSCMSVLQHRQRMQIPTAPERGLRIYMGKRVEKGRPRGKSSFRSMMRLGF